MQQRAWSLRSFQFFERKIDCGACEAAGLAPRRFTVLKKGDTLHSKVALFDNDISMIMSYNIHPRSELIEDEMAYLISDLRANTRLRKALENDSKSNYQIKEDTEIKLTEDYLSQFINRLLYNQL